VNKHNFSIYVDLGWDTVNKHNFSIYVDLGW
jgi:hypothetical protein